MNGGTCSSETHPVSTLRGDAELFIITRDSVSEDISTTILVADDEPSLAELYTAWLEPDYVVKTANDGEEALNLLNADVDIALLDRQMPKMNGDGVVNAISDHDCECRTAMITAVEPDFDIIDLSCDDYLTKPVTQEELIGTVDCLLRRATYDEQMQSYFTLVSKKAVLETEKNADELADNPEYRALVEEIADLGERMNATLAELDDADYVALFRDLDAPLQSPRTDD